MLYRAKESLKRKWFDHNCRDILRTPPIETKKSGLVILSMVSHRDLTMYLAAIKSLYTRIKRGEIVILNDGTLTDSDEAAIKRHIHPVSIYDINKIDTGRCPKRGCWERLLKIADYVKNYYVIQLDADTVTVGDIPEVDRCISENTSFILGTETNQDFQSVQKICERMKEEDDAHIQVLAEKALDKLNIADNSKYVRGCAGFSGFAKGSFSRYDVEQFSVRMGELIGSRWREWGSEQVASNFIIANSPHAEVLPYPKYASYYPHLDVNYNDSSFLHFIGKNRFKNNFYVEKAQAEAVQWAR